MEEGELLQTLYNDFIHSFKFAVRRVLVSKEAADGEPCCFLEALPGRRAVVRAPTRRG